MANLKKCPRCKVQSWQEVEKCDCGYNFLTGVYEGETPQNSRFRIAIGSLFWWLIVAPFVLISAAVVVDQYKIMKKRSALGSELSAMVESVNARGRQVLDGGIVWERSSFEAPNRLLYHYSLDKSWGSSTTIEQIATRTNAGDLSSICRSMAAFVEDGIVAVYRYSDRSGRHIGDITHELSRC